MSNTSLISVNFIFTHLLLTKKVKQCYMQDNKVLLALWLWNHGEKRVWWFSFL